MRILVDNALSFRVAELLCANGHDAQHVLDVGLGAASDLTIVEHARRDDRMILSIATDFGALLAQQQTAKASFILLRWPGLRRAEDQVRVLLANLPHVSSDLETGAVVVIEQKRVRVRSLPLGR